MLQTNTTNYFASSNCCSSCHQELFHLPPMSCHHVAVYFLSTLLSNTAECSNLIFYVSFPNPRNSHFSTEILCLLLANAVSSQDLGIWCAHFY
jgi:hypothetical protein